MTTISTLPPAPQPTDDTSTFNAKAFALLAALAGFVTEANAQAGENNTAAGTATTGASNATAKAAEAAATLLACIASASAAATSAGAAPWASGSYSTGQAARSGVDYRVYIARTTGAKPTDPSADPTNWRYASPNDLQLVVVTAATQTAAANGRYVLTNAAQSTLTAPPSPQAGDTFAVKVANGRFDNLINWNGAKHESLSDTTMALNGAFLSLTFVYVNATIGWVIA